MTPATVRLLLEEGHEAARGFLGVPSLVWQWLNLGLFLAALWYFLRKPAAGFFGGRRADVAKALAKADEARRRAEALSKELASRLATIETELQALKAATPKVIENAEGVRTTPSVVGILDDGERLTGEVATPILGREAKLRALEESVATLNIGFDETLAVGDGANDLDMLAAAGLGIAFNAKPLVRQAADTALSVPYLDAILFLLGISRDEVESADRMGEAGDS